MTHDPDKQALYDARRRRLSYNQAITSPIASLDDLDRLRNLKYRSLKKLEINKCFDGAIRLAEELGEEDKAKEFIKELSEKSSVKKDSILLIEIKSCRKVNITKRLDYKQHKI